MTSPAPDDPWAPARLAALGFILESEQRIYEAYVDGAGAWLTDVRGRVFSGWKGHRFVDPLGVYASGPTFTRTLLNPLLAAVRWVIERAFARAYERAPAPADAPAFTAVPWAVQHLEQVRNRMTATPEWLFGQIRDELITGADQGEGVPELAERVEASLLDGGADLWRNRGTVVARTETIGAYNGGTDQAFLLLADEFDLELEKVWLASMDSRTRDSHFAADGQRVPLNGAFTIGAGNWPALYPGDPSLPAKEVIQCRCSVLYEEPGEETDMGNRGMRGDRATSAEVANRAERGIIRARDREGVR